MNFEEEKKDNLENQAPLSSEPEKNLENEHKPVEPTQPIEEQKPALEQESEAVEETAEEAKAEEAKSEDENVAAKLASPSEQSQSEAKPEVVEEAKSEDENVAAKLASPSEQSQSEAKPEVVEEAKVDQPVDVNADSVVGDAAEIKKEAAPAGERKWYVIQAMTGQEDRVKQSIELTVLKENLKDKVFQVLLPTEDIVEIKGGKRVEKIKKMFPGYVFLEMILDEETWYQIRQTAGVARFIGSKTQPTPVSGREMQRVLKQLGKEERLEITFEKGEAVRVISGPFRGYTGTVDEVNEEKGKLKVLINIFGRDTPVEVNFEHAQKIV